MGAYKSYGGSEQIRNFYYYSRLTEGVHSRPRYMLRVNNLELLTTFISSEYRAKLYTRLEDKRVKKLKREQRKAETKDKYADTPQENKVLGWLTE